MDDVDDVLTESTAKDSEEHSADDDQRPSARARGDAQPAESRLTFCPIVRERSIGSLEMFKGLSLVAARTAVVVVTARGDYLPYRDSPPSTAELLRRRARFVSEVDLGYHTTRIDCELPSDGDYFGFPAVVDLHWRVNNPVQVVRDGVQDVRSVLELPILARLRTLTREFRADQSAEAENKVNQAVRYLSEAEVFGLTALAFVQLGMDDGMRDRLRLEARVAAYRDLIAAGDLNQFALRLAENPKDVAAVVKLLVEERDHHRRDAVDFVTNLIKSGAIERHQVDDQIRTVLQWLREGTHQVITGKDQARRASLGVDGYGPDDPPDVNHGGR